MANMGGSEDTFEEEAQRKQKKTNVWKKTKRVWPSSPQTWNWCKARSQLYGYILLSKHPATNQSLHKVRRFSAVHNILGVQDVRAGPQTREEYIQGPWTTVGLILWLSKKTQKVCIWLNETSQPSTGPVRWQGDLAAHLLQQASKIPWDAPQSREMCITPRNSICCSLLFKRAFLNSDEWSHPIHLFLTSVVFLTE